ncbi:hypothetical protein BB560_003392 [Smittium megazygosporum]|uniref:Uncharacterized protein n=1 Tax=Smittium megazygosporum TaxID=133381 RepID=A0A2T9ZC62_9FUNG|nr:hypothetical protein BB560_003392 [Smittium megazygosporum]
MKVFNSVHKLGSSAFGEKRTEGLSNSEKKLYILIIDLGDSSNGQDKQGGLWIWLGLGVSSLQPTLASMDSLSVAYPKPTIATQIISSSTEALELGKRLATKFATPITLSMDSNVIRVAKQEDFSVGEASFYQIETLVKKEISKILG